MTEEQKRQLIILTRIGRGNSHGWSGGRVESVLSRANEILNGYGVEAIRDEQASWQTNYFTDSIALYVNLGDIYEETLLYDVDEAEFILTSWGWWLEQWEQDNERKAR